MTEHPDTGSESNGTTVGSSHWSRADKSQKYTNKRTGEARWSVNGASTVAQYTDDGVDTGSDSPQKHKHAPAGALPTGQALTGATVMPFLPMVTPAPGAAGLSPATGPFPGPAPAGYCQQVAADGDGAVSITLGPHGSLKRPGSKRSRSRVQGQRYRGVPTVSASTSAVTDTPHQCQEDADGETSINASISATTGSFSPYLGRGGSRREPRKKAGRGPWRSRDRSPLARGIPTTAVLHVADSTTPTPQGGHASQGTPDNTPPSTPSGESGNSCSPSPAAHPQSGNGRRGRSSKRACEPDKSYTQVSGDAGVHRKKKARTVTLSGAAAPSDSSTKSAPVRSRVFGAGTSLEDAQPPKPEHRVMGSLHMRIPRVASAGIAAQPSGDAAATPLSPRDTLPVKSSGENREAHHGITSPGGGGALRGGGRSGQQWATRGGASSTTGHQPPFSDAAAGSAPFSHATPSRRGFARGGPHHATNASPRGRRPPGRRPPQTGNPPRQAAASLHQHQHQQHGRGSAALSGGRGSPSHFAQSQRGHQHHHGYTNHTATVGTAATGSTRDEARNAVALARHLPPPLSSVVQAMRDNAANEAMDIDTISLLHRIIVDTNIFMGNLELMRELLRRARGRLHGDDYIMVVPYVVVSEIDRLTKFASSEGAKREAADANRFIHDNVEGKQSCPVLVIQQRETEVDKSFTKDDLRNNDDKIMQCAMYFHHNAKRNERVYLLTNDKNLHLKAFGHSLPHASYKDMLRMIDSCDRSLASGSDSPAAGSAQGVEARADECVEMDTGTCAAASASDGGCVHPPEPLFCAEPFITTTVHTFLSNIFTRIMLVFMEDAWSLNPSIQWRNMAKIPLKAVSGFERWDLEVVLKLMALHWFLWETCDDGRTTKAAKDQLLSVLADIGDGVAAEGQVKAVLGHAHTILQQVTTDTSPAVTELAACGQKHIEHVSKCRVAINVTPTVNAILVGFCSSLDYTWDELLKYSAESGHLMSELKDIHCSVLESLKSLPLQVYSEMVASPGRSFLELSDRLKRFVQFLQQHVAESADVSPLLIMKPQTLALLPALDHMLLHYAQDHINCMTLVQFQLRMQDILQSKTN